MRISDYQNAGWRIEEKQGGNNCYNIFTPEGDCFSYDDLIVGNCPVCSQLDDSIAPEFCDGEHEEHLQKRITQAGKLAKLIMIKDVGF